jgi:hypothetical protein
MAILSGPQREEVKRFFEGVEQLQKELAMPEKLYPLQ